MHLYTRIGCHGTNSVTSADIANDQRKIKPSHQESNTSIRHDRITFNLDTILSQKKLHTAVKD